ncbi:hypothetical protein [Cytobacillus horneckiae]|uniref:hypothetical protein n=1 Tax=Cytobacillus horneckiae TaxID=549687 RepID=UPI000AAA857C
MWKCLSAPHPAGQNGDSDPQLIEVALYCDLHGDKGNWLRGRGLDIKSNKTVRVF